MVELPTGTVTFLFTDIEGSTRPWEDHAEAMKDALDRHDAILRETVEIHDGVVFSTMGDGVAAAFGSAPDAVRAVLDAQHRLGAEAWGETGPLRVRMGLHTDEGRLRAPGEYVNRPPVSRRSAPCWVTGGGTFGARPMALARIETLAAKTGESQRFADALAAVVAEHHRKSNLMALIDQKGWS